MITESKGRDILLLIKRELIRGGLNRVKGLINNSRREYVYL